MNTVFVVGSLNIDQTIRVHSLPQPGETVHGSDATFSPGGKGGNQAIAAARAGAPVKFIGAVGDDVHGRQILGTLSAAHIDASRVRLLSTAATGTAIIAVDDHGENQIIVSPGANSGFTSGDVEAGLATLGAGDVLVLQLEIPTELVRQAAAIAEKTGAFVILNAAPAPRQLDGLLENVDLLVVNEREIRVLADLAATPGNHRELVRALPPILGPAIVCTAGAEGSFTWLDGNLVHIPALDVPAKDTTGAGDTFVGYLAASLLAAPRDLPAAMILASRASALAVTRSGAMESIPWRDELRAHAPSPLPAP